MGRGLVFFGSLISRTECIKMLMSEFIFLIKKGGKKVLSHCSIQLRCCSPGSLGPEKTPNFSFGSQAFLLYNTIALIFFSEQKLF